MDYEFIIGNLIISTILIVIVIVLVDLYKRFVLKKRSEIINSIPLNRETIKTYCLVKLSYIVTVPIITYYFSKLLRLIFIFFIEKESNGVVLNKNSQDELYNNSGSVIALIIFTTFVYYCFLIFRYFIRTSTLYTVRKDNYIVFTFSFISFMCLVKSYLHLTQYSNSLLLHAIITELFLLAFYLIVRGKVNELYLLK